MDLDDGSALVERRPSAVGWLGAPVGGGMVGGRGLVEGTGGWRRSGRRQMGYGGGATPAVARVEDARPPAVGCGWGSGGFWCGGHGRRRFGGGAGLVEPWRPGAFMFFGPKFSSLALFFSSLAHTLGPIFWSCAKVDLRQIWSVI